jgi:hypothetical protein
MDRRGFILSTGFLTTAVATGRIWDVTRDFGAAGDGATDDTAAIQAAVDQAAAAGQPATIMLPRRHRIDGTVTCRSSHMRFTGGGEILIGPTSTQARKLRFADPGGSIRNIQIDNLSFTSTRQITDLVDAGVIGFDNASEDLEDIRILNCRFSMQRDGHVAILIAISNRSTARRLRVEGCTFDGIRYASVALNAHDDVENRRMEDVLVDGNTFINHPGSFPVTISGGVAGVRVTRNRIIGAGGLYGVELAGSVRGCVIAENVFGGGFSSNGGIIGTSGPPAYEAHSNVVVASNTTDESVTGGFVFQHIRESVIIGNRFAYTGLMAFNGAAGRGVHVFMTGNWLRTGSISDFGGARVVEAQNYFDD